jgi:SHS2 domain-containing protein
MDMEKTFYTVLDHTADLRVSVKGNNMVNLFENAGYTLMDLMLNITRYEKSDQIKIDITGIDLPDLMVRWLSEILYLFEGENLIVTGINIDNLTPNRLESNLKVIHFNYGIHDILMEIKGVTYHQIEVTENNGIWTANVIFDL